MKLNLEQISKLADLDAYQLTNFREAKLVRSIEQFPRKIEKVKSLPGFKDIPEADKQSVIDKLVKFNLEQISKLANLGADQLTNFREDKLVRSIQLFDRQVKKKVEKIKSLPGFKNINEKDKQSVIDKLMKLYLEQISNLTNLNAYKLTSFTEEQLVSSSKLFDSKVKTVQSLPGFIDIAEADKKSVIDKLVKLNLEQIPKLVELNAGELKDKTVDRLLEFVKKLEVDKHTITAPVPTERKTESYVKTIAASASPVNPPPASTPTNIATAQAAMDRVKARVKAGQEGESTNALNPGKASSGSASPFTTLKPKGALVGTNPLEKAPVKVQEPPERKTPPVKVQEPPERKTPPVQLVGKHHR